MPAAVSPTTSSREAFVQAARAPVYLVSALAGTFRSYGLRHDAHALEFTERRWGEPVPADWITPELVAADARPDSDFGAFSTRGLIVATTRAAEAIGFPELELVPVRVEGQARCLLNPRLALRRYRVEASDVARGRSGAVLHIVAADFHAGDLPSGPRCFWFHDGRSARFLLCNEAFRAAVRTAGLSGLSFRLLGHAY